MAEIKKTANKVRGKLKGLCSLITFIINQYIEVSRCIKTMRKL